MKLEVKGLFQGEREREQLFFGKVPCSFPFFLSFPGQAQKLKLARTQLLRPFFFLSLSQAWHEEGGGTATKQLSLRRHKLSAAAELSLSRF